MNSIKSLTKQHFELTNIALVSKKHWNYSDELMALWKDDLTITPDFIKENHVFHVENNDDEMVGFYAFIIDGNHVHLDSLFVLPEEIGKGFGNFLMNDFLDKIKPFKPESIIVEADPNAENFYKKFGFETINYKPTKIKGRFLPIMKLNTNL